MTQKTDPRLAPCGFWCGDCFRYQAPFAAQAQALLAWLDEPEAAPLNHKAKKLSEVEGLPQARQALAALAALGCPIPCGAGGDGCGTACPIKPCAAGRGLAGCWECPEMEPCTLGDFLRPYWGDTIKANCRAIQRQGLDQWQAGKS